MGVDSLTNVGLNYKINLVLSKINGGFFMKKLRVGVIGCGRISVRHLLPLTSIEDVELVACCDIKQDRADEASKTYGIKAYYSYEEMIEKENLDAVHLCLPHYLHSKVAIYAFEHGVNVLTEKPMDVDLKSAEKAVATCERVARLYINRAFRAFGGACECARFGRRGSADPWKNVQPERYQHAHWYAGLSWYE
jgi:NADH/NAD ratio-sensing transcriptional regulator Rex